MIHKIEKNNNSFRFFWQFITFLLFWTSFFTGIFQKQIKKWFRNWSKIFEILQRYLKIAFRKSHADHGSSRQHNQHQKDEESSMSLTIANHATEKSSGETGNAEVREEVGGLVLWRAQLSYRVIGQKRKRDAVAPAEKSRGYAVNDKCRVPQKVRRDQRRRLRCGSAAQRQKESPFYCTIKNPSAITK